MTELHSLKADACSTSVEIIHTMNFMIDRYSLDLEVEDFLKYFNRTNFGKKQNIF